nr:hypothetical protein [Tanacetum cinerariifolium]
MDDLDNESLDVYERKLCYDKCEKMNAEALIFVNKRLVRFIDVTMEQWLDLKYGDHTMVSNKVKESVISTWLIYGYKKQFDEYMEIKKQNEVYGLDADDELSNLGDGNLIEENEIAQIFRIDTNLFHFETSLCEAFKEFNYLLKIDVDVANMPWLDYGPWMEPSDNIEHICEPFCFKNGHAKWHTCNWKIEKYCNDGDLPKVIRNGDVIYFESYEWMFNDHPGTNNHCETQKDQERFDEHELMGDDDDNIGDLEDYLIQKDLPYYVNKERFKERICKLLGIPYVKPPICKSKKCEDLVFQHVFDELFSPSVSVASPVPTLKAPAPVESTGTPSSTPVDQDVPPPSTSQPLNNHNPKKSLSLLKKSHMTLRPVSTRLHLHEQALFCYYDAFLNSVEPKTYKDALTKACWIKAIQEELNEFKCLKVRELVPHPDKVMVITLKWIYKTRGRSDISRVAAHMNMIVYHMDVKMAFLNGILCKEVYVSQPDRFVDPDSKSHVQTEENSIWVKTGPTHLNLLKDGIESCDPVDTLMVEKSKLDEDPQGKAVDPTHYRGMVGTLMYLTSSRPYLIYDVCMCAWYQACPTDYAIALKTFADADHAGCQHTRRSTSGSMQLLGDRLVLWMRSQLTDYGLGFNKISMYCDNKSAIALCYNNVQHSRSKHIDIRYHLIKEQLENGVVELYFVRTEYQLVDILTKALCRERIEFVIDKLGMRSFTLETLKELADEAEE